MLGANRSKEGGMTDGACRSRSAGADAGTGSATDSLGLLLHAAHPAKARSVSSAMDMRLMVRHSTGDTGNVLDVLMSNARRDSPMSLYDLIASKGRSGFGYSSTAEEVSAGLSLAGKTILVTGCNTGLGLETMRVLAMRGARVVGTARTLRKAAEACSSVQGSTVPLACELSDPASVRQCVMAVKETELKLDAIICNAGIMALPELQKAQGWELQFFTNHIGHFMLVTALIDQLSEDGRIVVVSSAAHHMAPKGGVELDNLDGSKSYGAWRNYGQSKFANILFAKELSRRFEGSKRTANALHPGAIVTNLYRHTNWLISAYLWISERLFMKSIPQGAATQVYVAAHPDAASISGEYFADCNVASPRKDALDAEMARALWQKSEQIVAGLA